MKSMYKILFEFCLTLIEILNMIYSDEFLLLSIYHNNLVVYHPGLFICMLGSGMLFIKDKEISSNQPAYNDEYINLECFRSAEF